MVRTLHNIFMRILVPLSRVRDFHASFKSICDNFSIDLSEFEHIFGKDFILIIMRIF